MCQRELRPSHCCSGHLQDQYLNQHFQTKMEGREWGGGKGEGGREGGKEGGRERGREGGRGEGGKEQEVLYTYSVHTIATHTSSNGKV